MHLALLDATPTLLARSQLLDVAQREAVEPAIHTQRHAYTALDCARRCAVVSLRSSDLFPTCRFRKKVSLANGERPDVFGQNQQYF